MSWEPACKELTELIRGKGDETKTKVNSLFIDALILGKGLKQGDL